jgi:hypothetical protein
MYDQAFRKERYGATCSLEPVPFFWATAWISTPLPPQETKLMAPVVRNVTGKR